MSQKDDVHVCIMCLRAIMNYQVSISNTNLRQWQNKYKLNNKWDTEKKSDFPRTQILHQFSNHILFSAFFTLQYGFNMVMSHAHAVNEIALSLNNKNSR